jgi:zinc transporter
MENPGYLHRLPLAPEENGAANGANWLHMCIRHPETTGQLVGVEGLDRLTVEAMMRQEARSRIQVRDDGVMVLLKAMHKREGFRPEDMISLRIWVDRERVITTREADVDVIIDLRDRLLQGKR